MVLTGVSNSASNEANLVASLERSSRFCLNRRDCRTNSRICSCISLNWKAKSSCLSVVSLGNVDLERSPSAMVEFETMKAPTLGPSPTCRTRLVICRLGPQSPGQNPNSALDSLLDDWKSLTRDCPVSPLSQELFRVSNLLLLLRDNWFLSSEKLFAWGFRASLLW